MVLRKINQPSLRERAVQELRDGIANGRLRPGARLLEVKVSEQLGVSRGTVREAFRQLEEEGLLTSVARGSVYVRALSRQEVRDIYAVRAALEGLAARSIAASAERDAAVDVLQGALRSFTTVVGGPYSEQIERDLNFHETLCTLADNGALLTMWRRLSGPIRAALISVGPSIAHTLQTAQYHQGIIDAIVQGDGATARQAIEQHMAYTADVLAGALEKLAEVDVG